MSRCSTFDRTMLYFTLKQSGGYFTSLYTHIPKHCTFRYNDPTEAANMRLNLSNSQHGQHLLGNHLLVIIIIITFCYFHEIFHIFYSFFLCLIQGNQSLLSQSLSDLRSSPMILNETQRNNLHLFNKSSTPVRKRSSNADLCGGINNLNNNCDVTHEDLLEEETTNNFIANNSPSNHNALERLSRIASPDSMATMTPTSSQGSLEQEPEMTKLNEAIVEQKDIVMKCLESDQCDINALNEQLEILQTMQQK